MIRENDSLVGDRETLSGPKTRRMEYHTERIVTVKFHPSVIASIVLAGIFFVLSAYFSN
jgi:hypothetical protein